MMVLRKIIDRLEKGDVTGGAVQHGRGKSVHMFKVYLCGTVGTVPACEHKVQTRQDIVHRCCDSFKWSSGQWRPEVASIHRPTMN